MINLKVSVIVPVYKVEESIKRCIDSILNQTYQNIELILVDDGSPDNSGKICDQYLKDSRVQVIHNKNKGVSFARNTGLKMAQGDYITFCDSDDFYSPNHIEKMVYSANKYNADITISGFFQEQNKSFFSSVKSKSSLLNIIDIVKHFTLDNEFGGYCWNKLFKRSVIIDLAFPEDLDIMEDTYFLCQAIFNASIMYYLAEPSYFYCDNQESAVRNVDNLISGVNTLKYSDSYKRILNDFYFDRKAKNLIEANLFKIAIDFKGLFQKENYNYSKQLMNNINADISKYKKAFVICDEIDIETKMKYALKSILVKI